MLVRSHFTDKVHEKKRLSELLRGMNNIVSRKRKKKFVLRLVIHFYLY